MKEPTDVKGVQQLTRRVAALSRFITKLGEKALLFYKLLKKTKVFEWTQEAKDAFQALKRTLSMLPVLVAPQEKERLYLYIAATHQVVSTVIVVERLEEESQYGVHRPVYYLSEVLTPSKQRYPRYQKLAYGVYMMAHKLRHYFQDHPITVVCKASLSDILNNCNTT